METTLTGTDNDILQRIKHRDGKSIRKIYSENFPIIRNMVLKANGSVADAEDVFQEALIIVYNKVIKDELVLSCTFRTYLYAVCNKLWMQRFSKNGREIRLPDYTEIEDQDDVNLAIVKDKMFMLYQVYFLKLSDECQQVLRLYISKVPMEMIAKIMGYKSENYAKVKKYMCKQQLKNYVLNDPRSKPLLEEYLK
jgi:RNA polymerase sigma factor (sigma-70 family)